MADIIKFKRGKSTTWKTKNLLLLDGEPGFEIDTLRLKIGDGKTKWNDLPYQDQNNENVVNARVLLNCQVLVKKMLFIKFLLLQNYTNGILQLTVTKHLCLVAVVVAVFPLKIQIL